jgi:hypothetical protein
VGAVGPCHRALADAQRGHVFVTLMSRYASRDHPADEARAFMVSSAKPPPRSSPHPGVLLAPGA